MGLSNHMGADVPYYVKKNGLEYTYKTCWGVCNVDLEPLLDNKLVK